MTTFEECAQDAASEPACTALARVIPLTQICAVFQAREFREDRYYRSQERGYDVGNLFTIQHWIESGHSERFRVSFDKNHEAIQRTCAYRCWETCKVYDLRRELGHNNGLHEEDLEACSISIAELHALVERK